MKSNRQFSILVAGLCVGLSACEGGRQVDTAPRADLNGFVAAQAGGIRATVDSSSYDYTGDRRLTQASEGRRSLKVVSLASDHSYWQIESLPELPGQYSCDENLRVALQREGMELLRFITSYRERHS